MTQHWIKGFCLSLILLIGISSQSHAQKANLSKKALNERITQLENDNEQLKSELTQINAALSQLEDLLKKRAEQDLRGSINNVKKTNPDEEAQHDSPLTSMTFEKMEHDFGKMKEGDALSYTFVFTNTGKFPLKISNAKGSCGCTVPQWPKEAIPAGGQGEIKVTFNSKGKSNQQAKSVTLTANTTPVNTRLIIRAFVEK